MTDATRPHRLRNLGALLMAPLAAVAKVAADAAGMIDSPKMAPRRQARYAGIHVAYRNNRSSRRHTSHPAGTAKARRRRRNAHAAS